ncbi:MAG: hypothetical protein ACE5GY_08470 [Thermodesulfobacteriota bacterium]
MRIIFDLMGTVLGALDHSPRPGIRETITALRDGGNRVCFWTSGNVENYRAFLRVAGIEGDVYSKAEPLPFKPDVCVDDEPQPWMPGNAYKVGPHISEELPGEHILVAELMCSADCETFFWD